MFSRLFIRDDSKSLPRFFFTAKISAARISFRDLMIDWTFSRSERIMFDF
jgi:hypothetical protein